MWAKGPQLRVKMNINFLKYFYDDPWEFMFFTRDIYTVSQFPDYSLA